ncbi:hypothetical protein ACQYYA_25745 [Pseudomonas aeruginosa]|uniref:hypothetical protein n=1 Tax=Pseudomonas aeruginosa TaxID=287 RepID=UPI001573B4C4|nr:hypothetical protein [Pseudomonas aeruginosa]MBG4308538.1 hypothetical protein [Pseudomonas aeruginosa]MBG5273726.1 hypothetical protein [Pseudomonas aeruginosa]MBG5291155.1 hypothetical protein [Pseudomonas aeruginosa]MBG5296078.1 hypothetical protein [Pseudomonas aeruginosa]MBH4087737.1 hypothetical protein [Pseudomonas aeruginosa]
MTLLDIEKLLDMTHHMSVHIPIELIISWEQSEEAWSVKDNCLNFVYVNRRYTELITPRFGQKNSLLSPSVPASKSTTSWSSRPASASRPWRCSGRTTIRRPAACTSSACRCMTGAATAPG